MLKNYKIIKEISQEISAAAEEAVKKVFSDHRSIAGREEEITGGLRTEINLHLLEYIQKRLNNKTINGCKIKVATFKKKQEKNTGADLAGIIEITCGSSSISKAFLAQSKIGTKYRNSNFVHTQNDPNLLSQVENMLKLTSDSFVFIYTTEGIYCVPAFQVRLANSGTVNTKHHPFHRFGRFFEEFFKCFIGDHKIAPDNLGIPDLDLEEYAERLSVNSVFHLNVQVGDKDNKGAKS